jgi:dTDP-glucose 4,6-dehydratase
MALIPIYGDGLQIRDWLYVTDHCAALAAVMHQGVPGEIYNIGGGCEGLTNVEVVQRICDVLGKSSDCMQFILDRPGHDRHYAIDFSKLHKALGWRPLVEFDEGLARTVRWYMDNESWWRE